MELAALLPESDLKSFDARQQQKHVKRARRWPLQQTTTTARMQE